MQRLIRLIHIFCFIMPLNSFHFWLVFPFIFSLYWLIPSKFSVVKKWFLIIVSYLIYMNWKPAFAIVLIYVTLITYFGARIIEHRNRTKGTAWVLSLLAIFPLFVFKYYNFINANITAGLEWVGLHFDMPGLNWAIPVGISFFTFQAVGYFLDVHYKKIEAEKSFTDYVLFVSFFPQVASGPISKASELLPQIKNPKPFNYEQGVTGLKLLLWGMFLKTVIADRLGMFVNLIYDNYATMSGKECLLGSFFYSMQIYTDFAGYSFMAIGIAKLLGYDLINNFKRPYFSVSITDFWRRWHISLSRWLKDYVYIPLGGSRCGKLRNYLNILITFLVSGIWHGASWTFIVWGLLHGIAQIFEKALHLQKCENKTIWIKLTRIFVTFVIVNMFWIYFRMPTITDTHNFIHNIITNFSGSIYWGQYKYAIFLLIPIAKSIHDEFFPSRSMFCHRILRWSAYVSLFIMIILFGILSSGQFIYVNF